MDVVVAPPDVELAEYFHSLQVFNALCKVREWGDIFAGDSIERAVVDDVSLLLQVLFRDHEGRESVW